MIKRPQVPCHANVCPASPQGRQLARMIGAKRATVRRAVQGTGSSRPVDDASWDPARVGCLNSFPSKRGLSTNISKSLPKERRWSTWPLRASRRRVADRQHSSFARGSDRNVVLVGSCFRMVGSRWPHSAGSPPPRQRQRAVHSFQLYVSTSSSARRSTPSSNWQIGQRISPSAIRLAPALLLNVDLPQKFTRT